MAKRKRLSVPAPKPSAEAAERPRTPLANAIPVDAPRLPIAQVAGDAAAHAALETLAQEVETARQDGRMVQLLDLDVIEARHLVRDRLLVDDEDMAALKASLRARGQQTPIEVVQTDPGRYGLVAGFRRLLALQALHSETQDPNFAQVRALVRPAGSVSDSYVAMVEENEIRANLSFYERAHLACEAARLEIYVSPKEAVATLFAAASPARRSKILSFVRLHNALGDQLQFPANIPERLGLALSAAIDKDKAFAARLRDRLRKTTPKTAADERVMLERALTATREAPEGTTAPAKAPRQAKPVLTDRAAAVSLEQNADHVVLRGPGLTEALIQDLRVWLSQR